MRVIGFLLLVLATFALTTVHVRAQQTFRIVGNDATTAFTFNINDVIVKNPNLTVAFGEKITFRIETYIQAGDALAFGLSDSRGGDPKNFSSAALGSLTPSSTCVANTTLIHAWYVNQTSGAPCIITWTAVAPATGTNFYYTSNAKAMSAAITVTGIPTTPPTTTAAPTTPAPTGSSSSTGKNGAAVIVPGAAAFIIAAINALFAA